MLASPLDRLESRPGPLGTPAVVFLAAVWLLCRPYEGLIHDGILYAGQALRHLHPEVFDGDLFFAGAASQDDFTVFGRVYAALAAALGLSVAGLLLYALGQAVWFAVALAWIRSVAPTLALPAVACLLALRYPYATDGRLELAESFVTARLLAEPLVLGGLLLAFSGRAAAGLGVLAAAAFVHPLMAAPAFVVLGLLWISERAGWRMAIALSAVGVASVAAFAWFAPVRRMDSEWLELVRLRNHFVVPAGWTLDGLARWATAVLMLVTAASLAQPRLARLWRAVALAALIGVLVSVVALLTRWAGLIQVQAWRSAWLAVWFAPLAAATAWLAIPAAQRALRLRVLSTVPAFVLAQTTWLPGAGLIAMGWVAAVGLSMTSGRRDDTPQRHAVARVAAVGLSVVAMTAGALAVAAVAVSENPLDPFDHRLSTFAVRMLAWLPIACLAWWALRPGRHGTAPGSEAGGSSRQAPGSPRRLRWAAAVVLVAAILLWDARPPMAREAESAREAALEQWRSVIPAVAQVYWPERHRYVWFRLQRRSYMSFSQGAGILYDRETALQAYRRRAVIADIATGDGVFALAAIGAPRRLPVPSEADLRSTCGADPALDFLVLAGEIAGNTGPPYREPFSGTVFRLYACRDFR